jgi:N utilization substance protein B
VSASLKPSAGGGARAQAPDPGAHPVERHRARAWALQILYWWEASGTPGTLLDALAEVGATRRIAPCRLPYIERLLSTLQDHLEGVDDALRTQLDNWRLDRLAVIDRGILRLAATEILHLDDVPPKVSIQEAVRLAEAYGGLESPGFVNGVLDGLYRRERPGS